MKVTDDVILEAMTNTLRPLSRLVVNNARNKAISAIYHKNVRDKGVDSISSNGKGNIDYSLMDFYSPELRDNIIFARGYVHGALGRNTLKVCHDLY